MNMMMMMMMIKFTNNFANKIINLPLARLNQFLGIWNLVLIYLILNQILHNSVI